MGFGTRDPFGDYLRIIGSGAADRKEVAHFSPILGHKLPGF
jgi:hypothetical protein